MLFSDSFGTVGGSNRHVLNVHIHSFLKEGVWEKYSKENFLWQEMKFLRGGKSTLKPFFLYT